MGSAFIEHLDRIGCKVTTVWPIPEGRSSGVDIALLAIDHDSRDKLRQIIGSQTTPGPTIPATVRYENPSTLQPVLEVGAHADWRLLADYSCINNFPFRSRRNSNDDLAASRSCNVHALS